MVSMFELIFNYFCANSDPIITPVIAASAPISIGGKKYPIITCIRNIIDQITNGRSMANKSFVGSFISKGINIVNILNYFNFFLIFVIIIFIYRFMRIKSFRLFEAARGVKLENNFDGVWELYEDIKSIEYILEEGGYEVIYKFLFKERKNGRYYNYLDENNVKRFIGDNNTHIGKFIGINIEVAYPKDRVIRNAGGQIRLTPEEIERIGNDSQRYSLKHPLHLLVWVTKESM